MCWAATVRAQERRPPAPAGQHGARPPGSVGWPNAGGAGLRKSSCCSFPCTCSRPNWVTILCWTVRARGCGSASVCVREGDFDGHRLAVRLAHPARLCLLRLLRAANGLHAVSDAERQLALGGVCMPCLMITRAGSRRACSTCHAVRTAAVTSRRFRWVVGEPACVFGGGASALLVDAMCRSGLEMSPRNRSCLPKRRSATKCWPPPTPTTSVSCHCSCQRLAIVRRTVGVRACGSAGRRRR